MSEDKKQINTEIITYFAIIILITQIISLILTNRFIEYYSSLPAFEPAGQGASGSILNTILLLSMTFLMSMVMLVLIRKKRYNTLRIILGIVLFASTSIVAYSMLNIALYKIIDNNNLIALTYSVTLVIISILSLVKSNMKKLQFFASINLAIIYGRAFALFIKPPTILILPIAFAIYDIWAVFKGPLKEIVKDIGNDFELNPLVLNVKGFQIGLGDLIFYSMIPSAGLLLINLNIAIVLIILIQIGTIFTLLMLRKFKMFPGLPIPIFLSVAVLIMSYYL